MILRIKPFLFHDEWPRYLHSIYPLRAQQNFHLNQCKRAIGGIQNGKIILTGKLEEELTSFSGATTSELKPR